MKHSGGNSNTRFLKTGQGAEKTGAGQPCPMPAPAKDNDPMPDEYAFDVFISYSSKDKAWVRGELLKSIEQAGLAAFPVISAHWRSNFSKSAKQSLATDSVPVFRLRRTSLPLMRIRAKQKPLETHRSKFANGVVCHSLLGVAAELVCPCLSFTGSVTDCQATPF